jgi:hypothetical protein
MSIASEIQRLSGVRGNIFDSITNKGVTVPETATFSSCPDLINSIVTGGGAASSFINTGFNATGETQYMREFTATQIYNPGIVALTGSDYGPPNLTLRTHTSWPQIVTANFSLDKYNGELECSGLIYGARSDTTYSAFQVTMTGNIYYDIQSDPKNPTDSPIGYCSAESGSNLFSAYITAGTAFEKRHSYYGYCTVTYVDQASVQSMNFLDVSGDFGNPGYPYPTYPSATTGYISAGVYSTEYFNKDTPWVYSMNVSADGYKEIHYDNAPHPGSNSGFQFTSGNVAIDENIIENTSKEYVSNSAIYEPLSGYTYEFGSETTSYTGYQGW